MAQWITDNWSGENSPCYGKPGKNKGKKFSPEIREIMRIAALKRVKEHLPAKVRACINLDTGDKFRSISDAKRKFPKGNIGYAIQNGGTAGGYKWAYLDENGDAILIESKLKGYAAGKNHIFTRDIINVKTKEIFHTASDAGASIGLTGAAVLIALREGRKNKKATFRYV